MSSPFSIFRKNQRVWMAMLVVVAMVSFIILPIFTDFGQQMNQVDRTTAVRWKNGSISHDELNALVSSYQRSYQFLDRLAQEVVQQGGRPNVPGFSNDGTRITLGLQEPQSAASVVQTKLLADEARRHGVYIDDQTVDLYIQELTNGRISQSRYLELMRETVGRDLNRFQLYRFIKDEICKQLLLQMQASSLAHNGAPLVTPSNNWENFRKFEQRAKVEAFPVAVSSYVDKVQGEPTDRELLAIYEEGKDRFSNRDVSPEFGFARRYAADFEYVRGYMDNFLKAEKKTITEDQIKAEYDRRVAAGQFQVEDKPGALVPTTPDKATQPAEGSVPAPAEGTAPSATNDKAPDAEQAPSNSESAPAESASPTPGSANSEDSSGTATPSTSEAPKSENGEAAPAEAKTNESGSVKRPVNPLRLVAFQDDAESSEVKTDAVPTEEAKDTADQPSANVEATPAADAANSQPAQTAPDAETTPGANISISPAVGEQTASPAAPGDTSAPAKPPMRTKSLEEVREEILQALAYAPAQQKLQEALQNVLQRMETYQQDLQYYTDAQRTGFDKNIEPPAPLDLTKLADEFGLEYGRTGMLDAVTSQATDLGKSFFQSQLSYQSPQFSQLMFDKKVRLYVPYTFDSYSLTSSLSSFVTWKVEEKDQYVPTFEQAREEVLTAWKETKARELAQAYAQELASKLEGKSDWSDALSETDQGLIQRPSPFTWLQQPSFMSQSNLMTRIDGIGYVDDQFMKDSFDKPVGTYSVAPTLNKDHYYVLKTLERLPGDEDVLQKFAANSLSPATQTLASAQFQTLQAAYFDHYREELDLDMSGMNQDYQDE
jgi:hypothetical protein